jgi:hypothetical protein
MSEMTEQTKITEQTKKAFVSFRLFRRLSSIALPIDLLLSPPRFYAFILAPTMIIWSRLRRLKS